jgi:dipeptidyl aminopeptidase/acylaminoacyl peptidase
MGTFLAGVLLLATLVESEIASAKAPLTHEAMWLLKRIGAPAVSPDAKWAVFLVAEPAYAEKDQSTDLWIVPADGSAPARKITSTKASESGVTWSDDSRRIAFSTKREGDEQPQIYVLDIVGGGESQRMTDLSTGARGPKFSPDGRSIAFVSEVFRTAADDEANKKMAKDAKDRKSSVRVYETFPVRSWDRWLEPEKQLHVFVQSLTSGSKPKDLLSGSKLVAEPGFGGTGFGGDGGESINVTWSPDGQSVVFAATIERTNSAFAEVATDLFRLNVGGGEPERIAHGEGAYGSPQFSRDGKVLFAQFGANNKTQYNNDRVVAFDWPSMSNQRTIVGPPFDRSVDGYTIAPDDKTLYFTAEDSGLVKVYSAPLTGKGAIAQVIDGDRGVYDSVSAASKSSSLVLIGRWGSATEPAEIVRLDPNTKKHRRLTEFNVKQASEFDWQQPEHFWFTNAAGQRVHSLLVRPANFDPQKKYPLLVFMHGGAANMSRDQISLRWNYHLLTNPGYVLVATNYRGSSGFGESFGRSIQSDPLKGPAGDINAAADEAIKRYPFIDASKQIVSGASYGGHLANWMEATTTRYKVIISHAGLTSLQSQWGTSDGIYHRELMIGSPPWEGSALWREQSPISYAKNFKTPILLSVGERDYRVPLNNTLEMYSALQRMRVPTKLMVWPDGNHWITSGEDSRVFYDTVLEWMAKWLK